MRDFIPEVLNVAIPEVSNQGLLRGASCAGDETQTLDFVENPCVLVARQLRWRSGTKFISACQGKRSDPRPLCEVRWCEIGRDRKSTRLNSSHQIISYAVFCLKKKK